jgi:hypothetical protein
MTAYLPSIVMLIAGVIFLLPISYSRPGWLLPDDPRRLVASLPAGPGWLHEIKRDGFRIVALKQGALVKVWSRRAADFTDRFSRIAEAVLGLRARRR